MESLKLGRRKTNTLVMLPIYDNVNDNEEQVFVLTNNGQGAQQKQFLILLLMKIVPNHDVTVLMKYLRLK